MDVNSCKSSKDIIYLKALYESDISPPDHTNLDILNRDQLINRISMAFNDLNVFLLGGRKSPTMRASRWSWTEERTPDQLIDECSYSFGGVPLMSKRTFWDATLHQLRLLTVIIETQLHIVQMMYRDQALEREGDNPVLFGTRQAGTAMFLASLGLMLTGIVAKTDPATWRD